MNNNQKYHFTWEAATYFCLTQLSINKNVYELRISTATMNQQELEYNTKIVIFETKYEDNSLSDLLQVNKGLPIEYEAYQQDEETKIDLYLYSGEEIEVNVIFIREEEAVVTEEDIRFHAVQFLRKHIDAFEKAERYHRQVHKLLAHIKKWSSEQKVRHQRKAEHFTQTNPERVKIHHAILHVLQEMEQRIDQSLAE